MKSNKTPLEYHKEEAFYHFMELRQAMIEFAWVLFPYFKTILDWLANLLKEDEDEVS